MTGRSRTRVTRRNRLADAAPLMPLLYSYHHQPNRSEKQRTKTRTLGTPPLFRNAVDPKRGEKIKIFLNCSL